MLSICTSSLCHSQSLDTLQIEIRHLRKEYKKTEIVAGLDFQTANFKNAKEPRKYVEIGIGRSFHIDGFEGGAAFGAYVSEEFHFGDKNIYGTKFGVYTHYLFDIGFATVYYTDFKKVNLKLRPELGVGLGAIRIVGGYNIPVFGNKSFEELARSRGELTIQGFIPVKKTAVNEKSRTIFNRLF